MLCNEKIIRCFKSYTIHRNGFEGRLYIFLNGKPSEIYGNHLELRCSSLGC
jgi:hypothetical protein